LEAVRNRLSWLLLLILVLGFIAAEFAGGLAITDSVGVKSAVLGSFLRLFTVLLLGLFVITSQVREFQDKVLELSFSLAVPRGTFLLGKLLGYVGLGFVSAALCGVAMLLYAPIDQAAIWSVSLACEISIVVAAGLLCSVTFVHVTGAFASVFAFYLLSRSIASIQLVASGPILDQQAISHQVISAVIDAIAFLLPDLYRFTPSDWLIYHNGTMEALTFILAQSAIYVALLAAAGLFDLYRKNL
jgi:ABC-type transport system involved in multi-copper enzyme maturation permease subunit